MFFYIITNSYKKSFYIHCKLSLFLLELNTIQEFHSCVKFKWITCIRLVCVSSLGASGVEGGRVLPNNTERLDSISGIREKDRKRRSCTEMHEIGVGASRRFRSRARACSARVRRTFAVQTVRSW